MDYSAIKPVRLFTTLYNIEPCINQEHPEYHPDSFQYTQYWEEQERRCLEGFWFEDRDGDKGGWRYMPGFLYYYINFCVIQDEDEQGNTVKIINPMLRDVEWLLSYGWLTCRGFSGFRDDDKHTSNLLIEKITKGEDLTPKEKIRAKSLENCKTSTGEFKDYVDAREFLYRTHDKPLGPPLYENEARNFFVLGSRGFGKSFFVSNAIVGHEFNFYGKKYFDESYLKDPAGVEIFVGSAIAAKSSDLLKKFDQSQNYLKKNYGAWGSYEDFIPGYFYNNATGSLQPNNSNSPYRHEYNVKENGVWITDGTGTSIKHGVYTTENPQAAVGTRPTVMAIEEVGLLGNLLEVHAANETCQIRKTKFGSSVYIGTGGNMEKIIDSKIVFEDPESYNFLPYKDKWENRMKPIGFFLPAYYVDNSFKDKNGNTDLEAALAEEIYQRKLREKAANSAALDGYMMARPIFPSEMFLSPSANVFPTAKLRQRLAEVETKGLFEKYASIGDLYWTDNSQREVKWQEDITPKRLSRPVNKLNLDSYKGNLHGAVVIYEHPDLNIPNPTYRKSLYKVVYDPVQDDGDGTSLASVLVYKGYTDEFWNMGIQNNIVAEWIGRYDQVKSMHDLCLKLAYYYNALVLPETNIPDFIRYCKREGHVHKLMLSPHEAIAKAVKNPTSKYEWGLNMSSKNLGIHAEQLIRQWLLDTWKTVEDRVLLNIDQINSPRLLQELIAYDRDQNFDHVSSMKLLILWLANEKEKMVHQPQEDDYNPHADLDEFVNQITRSHKVKTSNPWYG